MKPSFVINDCSIDFDVKIISIIINVIIRAARKLIPAARHNIITPLFKMVVLLYKVRQSYTFLQRTQ